DVLSDDPPQQADRVGHGLIQVQDARLAGLAAAEGQEPAGEGYSASRRLLDGLRVFDATGQAVGLDHEHLGVARDDCEEVIEIVRDAAGKTTDGFHLLRLPELFLEKALLGDVAFEAY